MTSARYLYNFVNNRTHAEDWKPCVNRGPVCTLENFRWWAEFCFVGCSILKGRCLPLILKRCKDNLVWVWVPCYDRRSVGQYILEQITHVGFTTTISLLSDSYGTVDVGRSLWRQDESVVYNFCWCSPAQSFSGLSPMRLARQITDTDSLIDSKGLWRWCEIFRTTEFFNLVHRPVL
jgi:hypothetical protein